MRDDATWNLVELQRLVHFADNYILDLGEHGAVSCPDVSPT